MKKGVKKLLTILVVMSFFLVGAFMLTACDLTGGDGCDCSSNNQIACQCDREVSSCDCESNCNQTPSSPCECESAIIAPQLPMPSYQIPTPRVAFYGQTLSMLLLPNGWTWETPTAFVGTIGVHAHNAVFTTPDIENYQLITITRRVQVIVIAPETDPCYPDCNCPIICESCQRLYEECVCCLEFGTYPCICPPDLPCPDCEPYPCECEPQMLTLPFEFEVIRDIIWWNRAEFEVSVGSRGVYYHYLNRHDGNGFVRMSAGTRAFSMRNRNIANGIHILRVVARYPRWVEHNGENIFAHTVGYLNFQFQGNIVTRTRDFWFEDERVYWSGEHGEYFVGINRYDGNGFRDSFQVLFRRRIRFELLAMTHGLNTVRITTYDSVTNPIENGLFIKMTTEVSDWTVDFSDEYEEYVFQVRTHLFGTSVFWNGATTQRYRISIDRHDGNGFVSTASFNGAEGITFFYLNPSSGQNTVKFENLSNTRRITWSYENGKLTRFESKRTTLWNFNLEIETPPVDCSALNLRVLGNTLDWRVPVDSISRIYVNRHDGNGFVRVLTFWSNTTTWGHARFERMALTLGENTVRIVSSISSHYQNGTITYVQPTTYWHAVLEEGVVGYVFELLGNRNDVFRWNGADVSYHIYVDRKDGNGFQFIRETHIGFTTHSVVSLGLTIGQNTVRVVRQNMTTSHSLWAYSNGVLTRSETTGVGYWKLELEERHAIISPNFETTGTNNQSFRFNGSSAGYRVYVDREGDENFVFVFNMTGTGTVSLSSLRLTEGQNTVRISGAYSLLWQYSNGLMTRFLGSNRYWQINFSEQDVVRDYVFEVENGVVRFERSAGISSYRLYIKTYGTSDFIPRLNVISASFPLRTIAIPIFREGRNVIRIVASSPVWSYQNGNLVSERSIGYWEIDFVLQDFEVQHEIEIVGNNMFLLTRNASTNYQAHINRHDGQGFVAIHTGNSVFTSQLSLATLGLTLGQNTIRIISGGSAAMFDLSYDNGVLTMGQSTGYVTIYVSAVTSFDVDYEFEVMGDDNSTFTWNSEVGRVYRVYVDRKDGEGFVLIGQNSATNISRTLASLGLTEGKNTVRVIGLMHLYSNGEVAINATVGYWEVWFSVYGEKLNANYNLEIRTTSFWINGRSSLRYWVDVDRDDGRGFVRRGYMWGNSSTQIANLHLTHGRNVVRVVSKEPAAWKIENGVFVGTFSTSYVVVYAVEILTDYYFFIDCEVFMWTGMHRTYGVYIDRDDDEGFHFWGTTGGQSATFVPTFELTRGLNIVAVIGLASFQINDDRTITANFSVGFFRVYVCDDGFVTEYLN
ncbi:MAG: hypothetical protein FWC11_04795 [Firmicutes bacterium]|nr:hypothetical protein [Bacillota bacterium]